MPILERSDVDKLIDVLTDSKMLVLILLTFCNEFD